MNEKSIKPKKFKKSLKYVNLSTAENRLYKPSNQIKSVVSSMTLAEEGQPPSFFGPFADVLCFAGDERVPPALLSWYSFCRVLEIKEKKI